MGKRIAFALTVIGTAGLILLGSAGAATAASKGDLVLAKWGPDGLFYPGRVVSTTNKGSKIAFYDGDVATVTKAGVKKFDWKVGTKVQCNWKNKGKYFGGKIAKQEGEALFIHYDDGDKEELGIGRCRSK